MTSPSLVARPPSPPDALGWASALVDPAMEVAVARLHPALRPPVEHHLAGGGKRVRAALAVLSAAASGGRPEEGVVGAVAVELVHNFSLLHDDVIDGDAERRHRPTVWIQFGVGPAIIAGDALMTLAMQVLLEEPAAGAAGAASALAAATQQMIAGQALDMAFETSSDVSLQDCLTMSRGKTGALLGCAASIGAALTGASSEVVEALRSFGTHMGVAFQAVDDVLGIWGEPSVTGKPAGNDLVQHKKSVPVAAVLRETGLGERTADAEELTILLSGAMTPPEAARAADLLEERGGRRMAIELADAHLDAALEALRGVPLEPGPVGQLAEIARYVVERDR